MSPLLSIVNCDKPEEKVTHHHPQISENIGRWKLKRYKDHSPVRCLDIIYVRTTHFLGSVQF